MARRNWTRDELLVTFNLYCRTPFGRFHTGNSDVILIAHKIGRTPSAVSMKLCNFASFDPLHRSRDVRGLGNASQADRELWDEFNSNTEQLAFESQQAYQRVIQGDTQAEEPEIVLPSGPTEATRTVRTRLVQSFFREAVLTSYSHRCAICEIALIELLSASHIIPWRQSVERRADPRNGLSLCALHDRAFDRGLLTIDSSFKVLLSSRIKDQLSNRLHQVALIEIEGQTIFLPKRFRPDPLALAYHQEHIFK